jgi:ankyrin repeat protein
LKINNTNAKGVTPIGQALISRNIEFIQKLLDNGADVHLKCIFDPKISSKKLYPLQHFLKRLRIYGPDDKGRDD